MIRPSRADVTIPGSGPLVTLAAYPIRSELTVLSADRADERKIGFTVMETVGIGVINPRVLNRLSMSAQEWEILDFTFGDGTRVSVDFWADGDSGSCDVMVHLLIKDDVGNGRKRKYSFARYGEDGLSTRDGDIVKEMKERTEWPIFMEELRRVFLSAEVLYL